MDDELRATIDKVALTEVMTRYCFAVDMHDWALLDTVFTPECEALYILPEGMDDVPLAGRDAIRGWLQSVVPQLGPPHPRHAMTNHRHDVDGDRATTRTYLASGSGTYTAEMVRTPDGWRATKWEMRNWPRPA